MELRAAESTHWGLSRSTPVALLPSRLQQVSWDPEGGCDSALVGTQNDQGHCVVLQFFLSAYVF